MKVAITCGPAMAPIDEVRRITNFSTGELGITMANDFAAAGHEVVCFKGEMATTTKPLADAVKLRRFTTNDDLFAKFQALAAEGDTDVILHAAALCDYEVDAVLDEGGREQHSAKIPSRAGVLTLRLRPARKVLPALRDLFPNARIVGWKYELVGSREDALAAGARQLTEARTDLCVVNGAAYGKGFGLLEPSGALAYAGAREELCAMLLSTLARK
jgi:phosphopantothenoylcysteine decarboxylase/phosphopantothenate--cysteine ligase